MDLQTVIVLLLGAAILTGNIQLDLVWSWLFNLLDILQAMLVSPIDPANPSITWGVVLVVGGAIWYASLGGE